MPLKLMYITNDPVVAKIAELAGVDRIFIDLEYIGKSERQGGMDTVQSHHTIQDIATIRKILTKSELLVRCNPIHNSTDEYSNSKDEIDAIVSNGADIVMLPFFKTVSEVKTFIDFVGGRAKTMLLVETPESVSAIDEILSIPGIDYIHIGLNDLSIGYGKQFMFELLTDGTVDYLCKKIQDKNIPFGFGGIASLGQGMVPAENIIMEHYRLGSSCAILSRSFCNTKNITDKNQIELLFLNGVNSIREYENYCKANKKLYKQNQIETYKLISNVVEELTNEEN